MNLKVCEDCTECKKLKGQMVCHEMWDRPIESLTECPLGVELSDIEEINQKAKENKVSVGAKSEKVRKKAEKEPKIDAEKIEIVKKLAEMLESCGYNDVIISNPSKIVEFECGDSHFTVNLIRNRKKKA